MVSKNTSDFDYESDNQMTKREVSGSSGEPLNLNIDPNLRVFLRAVPLSSPEMQAFLPTLALPRPLRQHALQTPLTRLPCTPRRPYCQTITLQSSTPPSVESSAMTAAAATFLLKRAADGYLQGGNRPRAMTVLESLLQLERAQKRHGQKPDMTKLYGQWRLVFTGDPRKKFQTLYFPVRAHQTFKPGVFDNGIFLLGGALSMRFDGEMRFQKNRMEFTVDRLRFKVGGWTWEKTGLDEKGGSLEGRNVKDLPFFTFFLVRDDLLAARGRTGGVALYAKVPEDQQL